MVERKLGLSFLPQIAVTKELHQGKLVAIEIDNVEPLRRNLDVIYPRHRPLTRDAQALFQLLQTAADAETPIRRPRKRDRKPRR